MKENNDSIVEPQSFNKIYNYGNKIAVSGQFSRMQKKKTKLKKTPKKPTTLNQKQTDLLWASLFENPALWPGELYELDIICNVSYLLQDSLERCEVNKGYKEALNTKYFKIHLYWNILR